jgi:hypothetical protein
VLVNGSILSVLHGVNFMGKVVGLTTSRFSVNVVERVVNLCRKCSDCWPVHQAEGLEVDQAKQFVEVKGGLHTFVGILLLCTSSPTNV